MNGMIDQRGLEMVGWGTYRLENGKDIPGRVIRLAIFGIALYEPVQEPGPNTDGVDKVQWYPPLSIEMAQVHYRHAGLVRDLPTAIGWLRGEDVEIIGVYPISTDVEGADCEKEE